jgi:hypothetical protein
MNDVQQNICQFWCGKQIVTSTLDNRIMISFNITNLMIGKSNTTFGVFIIFNVEVIVKFEPRVDKI